MEGGYGASRDARKRTPASVAGLVGAVRRVLLIRLRALGDAILMTPVATALKTWRPSLHLSVLMEEPLDGIFRRHPAVDEVIAMQPRSTTLDRLRTIGRIRDSHFDLVFNMHSGPTAGLLTALSGAPLRVAYERARFASACNLRVPPSKGFWGMPRVHTVRHQLSPLVHLGIPVPQEPEVALQLDPSAEGRVREQMEAMRLSPGRFVVMQPFSKWLTKEWAPARFVELARRLTAGFGVPVLVIPPRSERPKLERLLALDPGAIVGLPDVPLEEMMVWIDQCGLFVGNDSGPTHAAAALKKKIVVIFGSADPSVWHPWAAEHQILSSGFPCVPCPGDRCYEFDSPRCVESISVDQVHEAAARLKAF